MSDTQVIDYNPTKQDIAKMADAAAYLGACAAPEDGSRPGAAVRGRDGAPAWAAVVEVG